MEELRTEIEHILFEEIDYNMGSSGDVVARLLLLISQRDEELVKSIEKQKVSEEDIEAVDEPYKSYYIHANVAYDKAISLIKETQK